MDVSGRQCLARRVAANLIFTSHGVRGRVIKKIIKMDRFSNETLVAIEAGSHRSYMYSYSGRGSSMHIFH
jgi:hypothetical protein